MRVDTWKIRTRGRGGIRTGKIRGRGKSDRRRKLKKIERERKKSKTGELRGRESVCEGEGNDF